LAGFGELQKDFDDLGARVIAASVDDPGNARKIADQCGVAVAHGVSRDDAEALDSWWEDKRSIIQPSEFVIDADGKVMASSYSSGPIGRIDAADVIAMIKHREAQK
jgi:peroxiredoxin